MPYARSNRGAINVSLLGTVALAFAATGVMALPSKPDLQPPVGANDDGAMQVPHDPRLSCHIPGNVVPIPATDQITFKSSDIAAQVGITRRFGGIAVALKLTDEAKPNGTLSIVDAYSAGGSAWQTSLQTIDPVKNVLVNYNQMAGNSDANWGYAGKFLFDQARGVIQADWLPMWSDDYRFPGAVGKPDYLTSPCLARHPLPGGSTAGFRYGDGRISIVPSLVTIGKRSVLRLTNTLLARSMRAASWTSFLADQALYMKTSAAQSAQLTIFVGQADGSIVGPIQLIGSPLGGLRNQLRNVMVHKPDDWTAITKLAKYAVLDFAIGGPSNRHIGIAIHMADNSSMTGAISYRPHLACTADLDKCGNVQWHTRRYSQEDPAVKTSVVAGEVVRMAVAYDIAPLEELAAEGYRTR